MTTPTARPWPTPADDGDRKLLADVREYGWHFIGVEADDEGPAFAYTIGLYETFRHPEVILFGLSMKNMPRILTLIAEKVRAGEKYADLQEEGDLVEGYNVIFRQVDRRYYEEYLGYALWFYRGEDFPVLQCVWPDSRHGYPWHPHFHPDLKARQPMLCDGNWPFQAGRNRAVFTTQPVTQGGLPIRWVFHDADGDWQFLCGTTNRQEDLQIVSLACMVDREPALAELADLPQGWCASREAAGASWRREPMEETPA